ncbi:MAG: hypothetical protein NTV99_11325 [Deltaproteobacteria bacterium]|nr:hypothetical protein [Deltaproteobacteria bacterium]
MVRGIIGFLLVSALMALSGCGELQYVKTTPEAKNFHPKAVGVLPVGVGINTEAKGTIDKIIADDLMKRRWFERVLPSSTIQDEIAKDEELGKAMADYLSKLTTVNFSDPDLSRKMGSAFRVDVLLVSTLDFWEYTTLGENKVARVGLGLTLVEADTGAVIWSARHEVQEKYRWWRPELVKVAKKIVDQMVDRMPH